MLVKLAPFTLALDIEENKTGPGQFGRPKAKLAKATHYRQKNPIYLLVCLFVFLHSDPVISNVFFPDHHHMFDT